MSEERAVPDLGPYGYEPRLCACGCGLPTFPEKQNFRKGGVVLIRKGQYRFFRCGHNSRNLANPLGTMPFVRVENRWRVKHRGGQGSTRWARVVMRNELGRDLEPYEVVHHINGDKEDDRPENLQVLTQSEHLALHHAQGDMRRAA
jgi:hypothetical protein